MQLKSSVAAADTALALGLGPGLSAADVRSRAHADLEQ